jgi:hypothetical protein
MGHKSRDKSLLEAVMNKKAEMDALAAAKKA